MKSFLPINKIRLYGICLSFLFCGHSYTVHVCEAGGNSDFWAPSGSAFEEQGTIYWVYTSRLYQVADDALHLVGDFPFVFPQIICGCEPVNLYVLEGVYDRDTGFRDDTNLHYYDVRELVIKKTIPVELHRAHKMVTIPGQQLAVVTANGREEILRRKSEIEYDYVEVYDVHILDLSSGEATLLLKNDCRELGEVDHQGKRLLFVDRGGYVSVLPLEGDNTAEKKRIVKGLRPIWGNNEASIRFRKAEEWTSKNGKVTSYPKIGRLDREYAYDMIDQDVHLLKGKPGMDVYRSPCRQYLMHVIHFDSLLKGVNRARVEIEEIKTGKRKVLFKNTSYPAHIAWCRESSER